MSRLPTSLVIAMVFCALVPANALAASGKKKDPGRASAPQGDIAYVLVTFNDRPNPPYYDVEWAKRELLGTHAAFLREISYGRVGTSAQVFGWYRLDAPASDFCGFSSRLQKAVIAAVDRDIDFTKFGVIDIIVDPAPGCGPSSAHTGSPILTSTAEGKKWLWYSYWGNIFPDAHEFGHDMGFAHAGFIDCGAVAINEDLSLCTDQIYGDRFDPMGAGPGFTHYSIYRKNKLGFVTPDEVPVVTRSGTFTLGPMESAASAIKGLRIVGSLGQTVFWVEYRQPLGLDSVFSASMLDGAMVHVPFGLSGGVSNVGPDESIVDCTPSLAEHGTFRTNVVCRVGNTITDPRSGISLTTLSRTPTALTVRVDFEQPDRSVSADVIAASAMWSPQVPVAGKPMSFTVDALNQGAHPAHNVKGRLRIGQGNDSTWDVDLTNAVVVPTLWVGDSGTYKWPQVWTPQPGLHRYEVCTSGQYIEADPLNDCMSGTLVIGDPQSVTNPAPDLFIESMGFTRMPPIAGALATFNVAVKNQGGAAAPAQVIRLSIDEANDGTVDVGPLDIPAGTLKSAGKISYKWPGVWTPIPGLHKVSVCVDVQNQAAESNETNNCTYSVFVVKDPTAGGS